MILQMLAFCVLQAFCAEATMPDSTTDNRDAEGARGHRANVARPLVTQPAPTQWSQYTGGVDGVRNIRVPIPNNRFVALTSEKGVKDEVSICSPATHNERFMCCEIPHLWLGDNGDIFKISVPSNAQRRTVYGSVGYQKEDSGAGMLVVNPPREAPRPVWFSSVGSQPDIFYTFDVRVDSLCITRFLVAYYDVPHAQFFVRVSIPYTDSPPYVEADRIVVTWGEQVTRCSGSVDDVLVDEPVCFDFLQNRTFYFRRDPSNILFPPL